MGMSYRSQLVDQRALFKWRLPRIRPRIFSQSVVVKQRVLLFFAWTESIIQRYNDVTLSRHDSPEKSRVDFS
jgi:hypothetical protein